MKLLEAPKIEGLINAGVLHRQRRASDGMLRKRIFALFWGVR